MKRLKKPLDLIRRHADARVAYAAAQDDVFTGCLRQFNVDGDPALFREFDRVGRKVEQHLFEA